MVWPVHGPERPEDDYQDLMGAWNVERSRVVEAELLLTRARDFLELVASPGRGPATLSRREIRHLIAEIDDQLR